MTVVEANRWLHLRHPDGFDDDMFECFVAGCALWDAYVQTSLRERTRLGRPDGPASYVCLPPTRSDDRTVVTLPLAANSTVGSRASYEDAGSYLLREFFPLAFHLGLEEGLTEDLGDGHGASTNWRRPAEFSLGRVPVVRPPFSPNRS